MAGWWAVDVIVAGRMIYLGKVYAALGEINHYFGSWIDIVGNHVIVFFPSSKTKRG